MTAAPGVLLWIAAAAGAQAPPPTALPPLEVTAPATALPPAPDQLPSSATRVGRDALAGAQYQVNLSESLGRVPGLVANNRHNYAQDLQLSLRGFGARAAFGVRGLRLYTDGIPATMPDGQGQVSHFDLPSTAHVTVLRGPFSALYGSSSGGVIEIVTSEAPQPALGAMGWTGTDALRRYGATGALAGERWSALGSASWFETDGFRAHSAARRGGGQARVALGDALLIVNGVDVDAQDPLGLTRAQWEADPRQAGPNAIDYDTRKTVRQSQAGLAWTPAFGGTSAARVVAWAGRRETRQFQSIPDFVQGTVAGNPSHPGGVIDLERTYYGTDLRWLARLGRKAQALDVAVGTDLQFLDERRRGFQNYAGVPGPTSTKGVLGELRRDEDNSAASVDPYAQATWRIAGDWLALAGVRYATTRFRSDDRFVVAGNGDDSGAVRFRSWLPVAGLRYAPGALALHLAVSRGAETPTLNELAYRPDGSAGLNAELRAARSRNVELGARWTRAALEAELAVFRIDTTDEIVVASSSGGRTTFRNAAGTTRDGAEASLRWQGTAISATAAYGFIDARYDGGAASGHPLPAVPRHGLFGELAWRRGALDTAIEALYRDAVTVDDAASDAAPAYAVGNLRVALSLPAGFELLGRIDNLADRRYAGSVIVNEANRRFFEPAPGRSFGLGLRWTAPR